MTMGVVDRMTERQRRRGRKGGEDTTYMHKHTHMLTHETRTDTYTCTDTCSHNTCTKTNTLLQTPVVISDSSRATKQLFSSFTSTYSMTPPAMRDSRLRLGSPVDSPRMWSGVSLRAPPVRVGGVGKCVGGEMMSGNVGQCHVEVYCSAE